MVQGLANLIDRSVESPFCDERPAGVALTLVVIHAISLPPGYFAGDAVERLFLGTLSDPALASLQGLRVSAHFFIRRSGETIAFAPVERRAWHAGVSCWQGRERCNDFSVGIELEGDDQTPFARSQYERLLALLQALRSAYPTLTDIAGHCHIAPGRKTDPGPYFAWDYLKRALPGWRFPESVAEGQHARRLEHAADTQKLS